MRRRCGLTPTSYRAMLRRQLAQTVLLDLAGDGRRDAVDDPPVARDLETPSLTVYVALKNRWRYGPNAPTGITWIPSGLTYP